MKLQHAITQMEPIFERCADYNIFVLEEIAPVDKVEEPSFREYLILDVSIDEEDREINLITSQYAEENIETKALVFSSLYSKLQSLMPQYSDFSIYSSSATSCDDEGHWYRLDVPLVAFGWNDEDKVFGLIQQKSQDTKTRQGKTLI